MIVVFSVILFLLGLLGAKSLVTLKFPAFTTLLSTLEKYQEPLGILGIVFGGIYLVNCLDMIGTLQHAPAHFLVTATAVVVMIGLGLVFGLEVIRRNLKDTESLLFRKLEQFRLLSLRFQKQFGLAGVVLGLLTFFYHI